MRISTHTEHLKVENRKPNCMYKLYTFVDQTIICLQTIESVTPRSFHSDVIVCELESIYMYVKSLEIGRRCILRASNYVLNFKKLKL